MTIDVNTGQSLDFETSRVRGRLLAADDLDLYLTLYTDPSVMRHVGGEVDAEEAAAIFAKALRHNANPAARARYWRVFDRVSNQSLGLAAVVRQIDNSRCGDVGLMLVPKAQNCGLGVHILSTIIDETLFGSWSLGMSELAGRQYATNVASFRLMKRVGFQQCDAGEPGWIAWHMTSESRALLKNTP